MYKGYPNVLLIVKIKQCKDGVPFLIYSNLILRVSLLTYFLCIGSLREDGRRETVVERQRKLSRGPLNTESLIKSPRPGHLNVLPKTVLVKKSK